MAVGSVYHDEPVPPSSYTRADGAVRRLVDVGPARQLVAFSQDDVECFAVVDETERLGLVDAASGQDVWGRDWQCGRVQAWDPSGCI